MLLREQVVRAKENSSILQYLRIGLGRLQSTAMFNQGYRYGPLQSTELTCEIGLQGSVRVFLCFD